LATSPKNRVESKFSGSGDLRGWWRMWWIGLTVEEVSRRLSYTDTSTFCHAFKRWHEVPPSAYPRDR
jgi:AraC-like DNA-binding protein